MTKPTSEKLQRRALLATVAFATVTHSSAAKSSPLPYFDSSYDLPLKRGYYYAPLVDNGPAATWLKEVGKNLGLLAGHWAREGAGRTAGKIIEDLASEAGAMAGETAGFYLDNRQLIEKNLNTWTEEMSDFNSWSGNGGLDDDNSSE